MKTQSSWKSLSCGTSELPVLPVNVMLTVLMCRCVGTQSKGLFQSNVHFPMLMGILIWCNHLNESLLVYFTQAEMNDRSRHLSNCFITAVSSGRGMQVWNPVRRIKRLSKQQQYKYVLLRACSRSWLWSGVGQVGTLYDTPHLICSPGTGLAHVDFPKLFANAAYYYNEVTVWNLLWLV